MQILAYTLIKRSTCLCVLVHVFIQVTYHHAPSRLQGDRYRDFYFLISKHARLFKMTPSRPCTAAVALLCRHRENFHMWLPASGAAFDPPAGAVRRDHPSRRGSDASTRDSSMPPTLLGGARGRPQPREHRHGPAAIIAPNLQLRVRLPAGRSSPPHKQGRRSAARVTRTPPCTSPAPVPPGGEAGGHRRLSCTGSGGGSGGLEASAAEGTRGAARQRPEKRNVAAIRGRILASPLRPPPPGLRVAGQP